jgi:hypothetical protein
MHACLITATLLPGPPADFPARFNAHVLPAICRAPGFKGLYLLRDSAQGQMAALVLFDTSAQAVAGQAALAHPSLPELAPATVLEVIVRA